MPSITPKLNKTVALPAADSHIKHSICSQLHRNIGVVILISASKKNLYGVSPLRCQKQRQCLFLQLQSATMFNGWHQNHSFMMISLHLSFYHQAIYYDDTIPRLKYYTIFTKFLFMVHKTTNSLQASTFLLFLTMKLMYFNVSTDFWLRFIAFAIINTKSCNTL